MLYGMHIIDFLSSADIYEVSKGSENWSFFMSSKFDLLLSYDEKLGL